MQELRTFRNLRRRTTHSIRVDRNAHWRAFAKETACSTACGDSRKLCQMVKQASRGSTGSSETLCSRDVAVIATPRERLNRWTELFDELLNHSAPTVELTYEYDCITAPPTVDEVRDILHRLRNNKAPGKDRIYAEVNKIMPDVFALLVHRVFNAVWLSETYPADWSEAIQLPFFKKSDRKLCSNYRGISLIDKAAKAFAVLLLRRFQRVRDLRTRPSQGCFPSGQRLC